MLETSFSKKGTIINAHIRPGLLEIGIVPLLR